MAHIPAVLLPRGRDNLGGGGAEGEVSHKESVASSSGFGGGGWWQERQSHLSRASRQSVLSRWVVERKEREVMARWRMPCARA